MGPVTLMTYSRVKPELYLVAMPVTKGLFLNKASRGRNSLQQVKDIYTSLVEWEKRLPPELQLASWRNVRIEPAKDKVSSTFAMQALMLRTTYDNLQLIVHRVLMMVCQGSLTWATPSGGGDQHQDFVSLSRKQCWASAIQTSQIDKHPSILRCLRNTAALTHVGTNCLTSGVVLGMLALGEPSAPLVQDCKKGMARLIRIPKNFGFKSALWDQNAGILRELLRIVSESEVNAMVEEECADTDVESPVARVRHEYSSSKAWSSDTVHEATLAGCQRPAATGELTRALDQEDTSGASYAETACPRVLTREQADRLTVTKTTAQDNYQTTPSQLASPLQYSVDSMALPARHDHLWDSSFNVESFKSQRTHTRQSHMNTRYSEHTKRDETACLPRSGDIDMDDMADNFSKSPSGMFFNDDFAALDYPAQTWMWESSFTPL